LKKLIIHTDALDDLKDLLLLDDRSAKRIIALLEQVKKDPKLREKLREHGYRDVVTDRIDVKKWHLLQSLHHDAWRLRLPDLEFWELAYRIVYAYKGPLSPVYVLAIVGREDIDYDSPDHPFCCRILRALASL